MSLLEDALDLQCIAKNDVFTGQSIATEWASDPPVVSYFVSSTSHTVKFRSRGFLSPSYRVELDRLAGPDVRRTSVGTVCDSGIENGEWSTQDVTSTFFETNTRHNMPACVPMLVQTFDPLRHFAIQCDTLTFGAH
jgi:hypothetical protein